MNLYAAHYRRPFAFCYFLCPLHRGRCLRFGCRSNSCERKRRCMGFTSFPDRPTGWQPAMGLGTFFPPHVLGNPLSHMTDSGLRGAFWLQLLDLHQRDKRKLLYSYDGSIERSHMFPVPFTSAFLDRLVQSIGQPLQVACAHGACGPDAECLSVASHPAITRDARTAKVTPFQEWFQYETRSIKLVKQDVFSLDGMSQSLKVTNYNNC